MTNSDTTTRDTSVAQELERMKQIRRSEEHEKAQTARLEQEEARQTVASTAGALFSGTVQLLDRILANTNDLAVTDRLTSGNSPAVDIAATDGKSILLGKKFAEDMRCYTDEATPIEQRRRILASWHGVNYHELAHILFTPSCHASGDWYKELTKHAGASVNDIYQLLHTFNVLEDGRAENLMIARYRPLKPYFVHAIQRMLYSTKPSNRARNITQRRWMADNLPLVWGRKYIPYSLRIQHYHDWAAEYDQTTADDVVALVDEYIVTPFPSGITRAAEIVAAMNKLLRNPAQDGGKNQVIHTNPTAPTNNLTEELDDRNQRTGVDQDEEVQKVQETINTADFASEDDTDSYSDGADGDDSDSDDGSGGDATGESTPSSGSGDAPGGGDEIDNATDIDEALDAADDMVADDMNALAGRINDKIEQMSVSTLPAALYHGEAIGDGIVGLTRRISQAFDSIKIDLSPQWRRRQAIGRVNPRDFITARDGDPYFFDTWEPGATDEIGLEVVLLLDSSGSMSARLNYYDDPAMRTSRTNSRIYAVSQVAWSLKRVMHQIGMPCTVISFSDETRLVYGPGDSPGKSPKGLNAYGGTQAALAYRNAYYIVKHSERVAKAVICLTDGHFGDLPQVKHNLALINSVPGTTSVLYGYGTKVEDDPRGHQKAYNIEDPRVIVTAVREMLTNLVGSVDYQD